MTTLIAIYGARPEAQPSVLPPWPLFAVGMVMIAAAWGALAGALALALSKRDRGRTDVLHHNTRGSAAVGRDQFIQRSRGLNLLANCAVARRFLRVHFESS